MSPRLFRYLDQQHIDAFFDTGELRISSFELFLTHEDEQRYDQEGRTINIGRYIDQADTTQSVHVYDVSASGADAYVMCASVVESRELMGIFGVDGYFAIEDPWRFAAAIQQVVPAFTTGLQGHCMYSPRGREIYRHLDISAVDLMEQHKNADGTISMDVIPVIERALSGPERLFHKPTRYSLQAEYRILWGTTGDVEPHLVITCPEARQYCTRIT
jgi:hypothetical protein